MENNLAIVAGAALSAFGGDSQHNRLFRLDFPQQDGPFAILLANRLEAHEEVSRGYRLKVEVLSDDARIPLKVVMARIVTISLVREDGSLRYFNGYITAFRFARTDGGFAFYEMILEPWPARSNAVRWNQRAPSTGICTDQQRTTVAYPSSFSAYRHFEQHSVKLERFSQCHRTFAHQYSTRIHSICWGIHP